MSAAPRKGKKKRRTPGAPAAARRETTDGPAVFCTECGSTLENFCFSAGAGDLKAIRKTLAQCKKQGRFSGEFCSKLFIAHPEALTEAGRETDDPSDVSSAAGTR